MASGTDPSGLSRSLEEAMRLLGQTSGAVAAQADERARRAEVTAGDLDFSADAHEATDIANAELFTRLA
ncbi:hypothetical protein ACLQ24_09305 [Micromonospora sp. DT4]|uniref:hypothetical protein n=1 Tax=Micromonospora sp. DT4 TaxID=3393438 RepID=UPI003CF0747B